MHLRACRLLAITVFVYGSLGSAQAFAQTADITNQGAGVSAIAKETSAVDTSPTPPAFLGFPDSKALQPAVAAFYQG